MSKDKAFINETRRLEILRELEILGSTPEQSLQDWVGIAAEFAAFPKECVFRPSVIDTGQVMMVSDLSEHPAFQRHPQVISGPQFRFYAGFPIFLSEDSQALGTLCVLDSVPKNLTEEQVGALRMLARQAGLLLQLRQKNLCSDNPRKIITEIEEKLKLSSRFASVGEITSQLIHDWAESLARDRGQPPRNFAVESELLSYYL